MSRNKYSVVSSATREEIMIAYEYSEEKGGLVWRSVPHLYPHRKGWAALNAKMVGERAGSLNKRKDGTPSAVLLHIGSCSRITEHRAVWILHRGQPPDGLFIDHINGDATDNRIGNLRLATNQQNQFNSRPQRNSFHGLKGVSFCGHVWRRKPWKATITIDGKQRYLGSYSTKEEAAAAYAARANEVYGEFARHTAPECQCVTYEPPTTTP